MLKGHCFNTLSPLALENSCPHPKQRVSLCITSTIKPKTKLEAKKGRHTTITQSKNTCTLRKIMKPETYGISPHLTQVPLTPPAPSYPANPVTRIVRDPEASPLICQYSCQSELQTKTHSYNYFCSFSILSRSLLFFTFRNSNVQSGLPKPVKTLYYPKSSYLKPVFCTWPVEKISTSPAYISS